MAKKLTKDFGSNPSVQINVKWLGGLVDVEAEGSSAQGFLFLTMFS